MKLFTKLGLVLLALVFVAGVHVAQSQVDYGPKIPPKVNIPQTDDLFDLQFDFPVGVGGGEAGIETDGDYIYTSMWNGGGEFQKYDISGTWIETFTIAGTAGCRDIAYTGTYFYGGAASTTVFEMDFAGGTMVSTFSAPTDCRAIAYNEDDDAFYANNWGSAITKFDMAGANLGSFPVGPVGDSYYGFAYQSSALCGDGPFLWGHAQVGNTQNELVQIELPSGTESGVYFDVGTVAAVGTGIAGGLAIHEGLVTGYYTILGTSQNVNIWGLELCVSGPLPDNDLGVQSIVEPTTGVELTATEEVTVAVKNYGNNAQSSFDVWFTLDGGAAVTESVSVTINPGETYDHTFGTTVDLSAMGSYEFEACVVLAGDENADNDCATKTVENLVPSLCVPAYTTGCSLGDGFTDFALEEIVNNGSGCDDLNGVGWSQYFGLGPATLIAGGTHTITMATGYDNNYATVWIDFNDDLLLTEDEKVVDNFLMALAATFYDVDFDVPADAPDGQHIMRARTNWNAPCDDPCISYAYGEAEDYYVNVGGAPPVTECEDFDALTVGGYVAGQLGGLWTTWSGTPGTAEDALVSDAYSVTPSNSMLVEGGTDALQLFNASNITSGVYYYSHNIYIPDGTTGYWNLQKDIVPAVEWGFQIMYDDDGMYYVDAAAAAAVVAPFSYDTWYFNEVIIDLNSDWAEFYIDGTLIIEYQWTLGTFGNPGALTLGGANYFANPGAGGAPAGAHFDDVCFEQLEPGFAPPENLEFTVVDTDVLLTWDAPGAGTPDSYNVFRDGSMIANTTDLSYDDTGLAVGSYDYYVTAVYPGGESVPSNVVTATIIGWEPPVPQNLDGPDEVYTNEDIVLTWDEIGGDEWIQWDQGVNNGSAVGLTNGGTFSVASHWTPAELAPYAGWTIDKISFFPSGDPDATFTIKVWTGATGNNEVLSQDLTSVTIDQFNEVDLTTPITIDASQDLWFGYEVSHLAGTFPAGTDDGPAIQYSGDMITTGGAWESLYVLTSGALDYNWNIAAHVSLGDGASTPLGKQVEFAANDGSFQASGSTGNTVKFVPSASKDFQGYNVYRDGALLGFTVQTTYTDVVTAPAQYTYNVTSLWDEGESAYSDPHVVDVISGVNEHIFNSTELFPNPATDVVNVRSDYTINTITIYNHVGQEVAKQDVNSMNFQVNTANYTSGLYFFQIDTEEGRIAKRIIIE